MSKRTGIMLATMFTERLFDKMPKPVYIQPKIEGDRLRAVLFRNGDTRLLSSGGNERVSIPHIHTELRKVRRTLGIELDGEVYRHGMKHSEIRSIISRTKNLHPDHEQMEYHIFDIINTTISQDLRLTALTEFFENNKFKYLRLVPTVMVNNIQEVQEYYTGFLRLGYEGIIIRNLYSTYRRQKCTSLLKLKPRVSEFFMIIDVNLEYDMDGVSKDTFGSFTCLTKEGEKFKVGTGPTDYQRDLIWKHRINFIHETVKIRFQDYTKTRKVPKLLSIDKQWLTDMQKKLTKPYTWKRGGIQDDSSN